MSGLKLRSVKFSQLQIPGADPWYAKPEDPALSVMTDFRKRSSVTVSDISPIDTALEHMRHTGVRCVFAVDDDKHIVVGLVTAYDIGGERPLRLMQTLGTRRSDMVVRDLMQRIGDWKVVFYNELAGATVSSVAQLFNESGVTHIPVVETSPTGELGLRGLLSSAKIKRLLSR